MYIKWYDEQRKKDSLVNMKGINELSYYQSVLSVNGGYPSTRYEEEEEGKNRFADIVDALNSGNVIVYDMTQSVKYWKPKVGRKPKTQSQAPNAK